MSIDRRMRDGLHRNASVLDPAVEDALRASRKRGARMRWARRGTAAGVAAVLLVGVLGLSSLVQQDPVPAVDGPAPFAGVWQTVVQSKADAIARAVDQGVDPTCASDFVGNVSTLQYTLAVDGEHWIIYRADDGGALVGQEEGFWNAPDPGQIRLFAPNAPATYLFDSSISSSTLQLQPRRLALGGDPEACFVQAGSWIQYGAPFERVAEPPSFPPSDRFPIPPASMQGTWSTATVSEHQLQRAIDAAGAGSCAAAVLGQGGDRRFTLTIDGEHLVVSESGHEDQPLFDGFIEGGDKQGVVRVGFRLELPDPPEGLLTWIRTDGETMTLEVTEVVVGSGDPSCVSRAQAAAWFGFPFSRVS